MGSAHRPFDYLYVSWTNLTTLGSEYSPTSTGARLLKMGAVTTGALLLGVVAARVADIRTKAAQRQENRQLMLDVLLDDDTTPEMRAEVERLFFALRVPAVVGVFGLEITLPKLDSWTIQMRYSLPILVEILGRVGKSGDPAVELAQLVKKLYKLRSRQTGMNGLIVFVDRAAPLTVEFSTHQGPLPDQAYNDLVMLELKPDTERLVYSTSSSEWIQFAGIHPGSQAPHRGDA
jgi:hypothetical protein